MSTQEQRLRMAKSIVDFEARRDKKGHLVVYELPANDGGGRYEVAGINERYDHDACLELVAMIHAGRYDDAEMFAEKYVAENTDVAAKWATVPAVESYLRDIVFNRGARGALKTLQRAVHVAVDGVWGPHTELSTRTAERDPTALLDALRHAREWYEVNVVGYRPNFWRGLVNRWDGALASAKQFLPKESKT